jgi:DNA-binding transcriptional LysR family regulator
MAAIAYWVLVRALIAAEGPGSVLGRAIGDDRKGNLSLLIYAAAIPLAFVWPLVAAFYADCRERQSAHTRLRIAQEVLGGSWDALTSGRAELAIGAPGDSPSGGGYRSRALAEIESVFAVAPSHPLAAAPEPLTADALAWHRAVVAADSSRRLPARTTGLIEGQDTLTVPDLDAKLAAQIAGLGCGFLPRHIAAPALAAGRLVARSVEQPPPPQRLNLAWRAQRPGRALAWWIDSVARSGIGQQLAAGATRAATSAASPRPGSRSRAPRG